jgi:hypothetical protein
MNIQDETYSPSYGTCESDEQPSDREDIRLLNPDNRDDVSDTEEEDTSSNNNIQDGVVKIEAISQTWTQRSLIVAYLGFVQGLRAEGHGLMLD